MASLSVKSTRYTLKELKKESSFSVLESNSLESNVFKRAAKYIVLTDNEKINLLNLKALENLRLLLLENTPNDVAKYALPECYKTQLVWSINARSLQNFLELRSSKRALNEIRILAKNIYTALPDEHKYIFREFISELDFD